MKVVTRYTEFVGIRITPDQRDALDRLLEDGTYSSESELMRAALDRLVSGETPDFGVGDVSSTSKRVVVDLPGKTSDLLDQLVELEVIISPQDGMRQSVQVFFDTQLETLEENRLRINSHKKRQLEEKFRESSVNIPR